MEKAIWKFKLETEGYQTIQMPEGAEILVLQVQFEEPCLWALVDPSDDVIEVGRHIEIIGTGNPMTELEHGHHKYIGTYQQYQGQLVLHVFEHIIAKK